jgi:hypothetical protein
MELNKTYIKGTVNTQKITFERKFSKRKAIKPVKITEGKLTSTQIVVKSCSSVSSSSNQSVDQEIASIERRRCCAMITNTINSQIELPQQQIHELPTIQEPPFSDDDGFYSDTPQPKCPKSNDNIGKHLKN